jgi:hypothetical protein
MARNLLQGEKLLHQKPGKLKIIHVYLICYFEQSSK